ncbi:MAG TPA: hypothetical protein PLE85_10395 [Bacteroidales bacterium]|nr:hypothetical protein [Lentimicrobiaceae bacterium]HOI00933.1 hypothetical protein [Bacteroidales bacterium]
MKDKAIEALRQQIAKLGESKFDLEAWKTGTALLLARLFGESSEQVNQVRRLQQDFSSWTLRDTSGNEDPMDKVRRLARDIVEAAITELEIFGLPGSSEAGPALEAIRNALQEHLRMQEYRQLSTIVSSGMSRKEKEDKLNDLFKTFPPRLERDILVSLLSHPNLKLIE